MNPSPSLTPNESPTPDDLQAEPQPQLQPYLTAPTPQPRTPKNLLWLWITMTVSGLMIIGLIVSYVVIEKAATSIAGKYIDSAQSYLDNVYDTATTAADDPIAVVRSLAVIDSPKLESAFLGVLSADYQQAQQLQDFTSVTIDELMSRLDDYARVYEFHDTYQSLNDDITFLSESAGDANYLRTFEAILKKLVEAKNLTNEADLPEELDDALARLDIGIANQVSSWGTLVEALRDQNSVAYNVAYEAYIDAVLEVEKASSPIVSYNNALSSKVRAAAGKVRDFSETIR